jgi:hypothetical protein
MTGERIMIAVFAAFGALWIAKSLNLSYWADFAPGSGFLPLWLGVVIVILAGLLFWRSFAEAGPVAVPEGGEGRTGRVVAIALGLLVCLAVLDYVGFTVAIAGYLAFLLGWVERRSSLETALLSVGTSVSLWIIFKAWLGVPLPSGPWGF